MNEYFQKIKKIVQKYINYAKANNLKKKILKENVEVECVAGLSKNSMNPAVISIALQDADVVEKLHDDKNLLYSNTQVKLEHIEKSMICMIE